MPELAGTILRQLTQGRTLLNVCGDDGMPAARTVRQWALDDHGGFATRYLQAVQIGTVAKLFPDLEIADDALEAWAKREEQGDGAEVAPDQEHISRCLLRIEARCRMLASFLPVIHGDRTDTGIKHDALASGRSFTRAPR
jgi:hypothetical protein